ncbi:MAG: plastocyanin/azurin family copper-binding protein [Candidatus Nitrosotenuis sp.]
MEEAPVIEEEQEVEEEHEVAMSAEVSIPSGSSVPGCEATDECFIPSTVTIGIGGTVTWSNDDTAAHTVTSGSAETGPDGTFDSSILMAGKTFAHTFDEAGDYDYFCIVHPWMTGKVIVE